MNTTIKILKGYISSISSGLKVLFTVITFLIFVFGLSIAIVYPLWKLATNDPKNYSFFVLIAVITVLFLFLIFKMISTVSENNFKYFSLNSFLPTLKKSFIIILTIFIILGVISLFSYSKIYGSLALIVLLFIFGYFRFAHKK